MFTEKLVSTFFTLCYHLSQTLTLTVHIRVLFVKALQLNILILSPSNIWFVTNMFQYKAFRFTVNLAVILLFISTSISCSKIKNWNF